MTQLHFYKYQGAGNDFILLDNRAGEIRLSTDEIAMLCHRRFGIGADGLMLLEASSKADFRMVYFNADGRESSMCGNGGRCIVAFAQRLGIIGSEASFEAIDGLHQARVEADGSVSLQMNDVASIAHERDRVLLDTGSPHCILWVDDLRSAPVVEEGRRIRHEARFAPGGVNVNFVRLAGEGKLEVRTYERGVEDETLSCGTGVTAAAIAASGDATGSFAFSVATPGGALEVRFEKDTAGSARDVVLRGPARFVFEGKVDVAAL
jgi:diaminopimelate epimerase